MNDDVKWSTTRSGQATGCNGSGPAAVSEAVCRAPGAPMTQPAATIIHKWYPRPVFFVEDIHRAASFYIDKLGFTKKWHEADGAGTVCQVDRSDCEIILAQDATRRDKSRLFIELTADGLAELRREIAERSVPHKTTWWGYDSIQIEDPDGNELIIPTEI
jgi:catechol 2,3-dioxygenase-like lactoylglutathione lyase family enzyme